ncbi:hypothetical protein [Sinorhizobium numidicum]|uniref:hypothetical protein n=1 Tax=Sinorhizobium numidicum TaxID=680248 RepID=UPI0031452A2B
MAILALLVIGVATAGVGIGSLVIVASAIWLLVDLFLIPGMIRQQKEEVRNSFSKQMYTERVLAPERSER